MRWYQRQARKEASYGKHRRQALGRLLEARVVAVPMASHPTCVMCASCKPFCFQSLENALRFSDTAGAEAPGIHDERRNPRHRWSGDHAIRRPLAMASPMGPVCPEQAHAHTSGTMTLDGGALLGLVVTQAPR